MTSDAGAKAAHFEGASAASLSSQRARLASFEHAYAVALRLRRQTGRCQFILRTGNALQPVRTSSLPPRAPETLLAIIG